MFHISFICFGLIILASEVAPFQNVALGKPVRNTSSLWYANDLAVDGRMDFNLDQCSNTKASWWMVDLTAINAISWISVSFPKLQKYHPIGASVLIGNISSNADSPNFANFRKCGTIQNPTNADVPTVFLKCLGGPVYGRYVAVVGESPRKGLRLCEVQVFMKDRDVSNLALAKPAFQSTQSKTNFAPRATDGNNNHKDRYYTCTPYISGGAGHPYWVVDLGQVYKLDRVAIIGTECCASQFIGASVIAMNHWQPEKFSQSPAFTVCTNISSSRFSDVSETLDCNSRVEGRYVGIVHFTNRKIPPICEVEVYGYNLPYKKTKGGISYFFHSENDGAKKAETICSESGRSLATVSKETHSFITETMADLGMASAWINPQNSSCKYTDLKKSKIETSQRYCLAARSFICQTEKADPHVKPSSDDEKAKVLIWIIGAVSGSIVLILVIVVILTVILCQRKKRNGESGTSAEKEDDAAWHTEEAQYDIITDDEKDKPGAGDTWVNNYASTQENVYHPSIGYGIQATDALPEQYSYFSPNNAPNEGRRASEMRDAAEITLNPYYESTEIGARPREADLSQMY